jgi:N-methylhydantoinase A
VLFADGAIDENELGRTLERFHVQHQTEYGHAFHDSLIEVVNVRLVGVAVRPKLEARPVAQAGEALSDAIETPFLSRDALTQDVPVAGPAVILQTDSTTVVPPGCMLCAEPSPTFATRPRFQKLGDLLMPKRLGAPRGQLAGTD